MIYLTARHAILKAANDYQHKMGYPTRPYYMRHLNEAVCVCRRNNLVQKSMLIDAGFNPNE